MKVSGFSFIRNAIKYDYPVVEAIRSVLPLCDDFYLAVGKSDDTTLELVSNIHPKVTILETTWDDSMKRGRVLAAETNKALRAVPGDADWCFYIQADEVVHEKYLDTIRESMVQWKDHEEVDGLLFNYLHFFGSYDYIATAPNWYKKEIRVIRNNKSIYSYKDAQGFRKDNNHKLRVKPVDAFIYHYGWVKHPAKQLKKHQSFHRLYHEGEWADKRFYKADAFDYSIIDELGRFHGSHPAVMQKRISEKNWEFDRDLSFNRLTIKNRLKKLSEKYLGYLPGEYRNYKII